ncbi:spike base protein, RCAP_Rcc01079 family [Celeribacter indicus]|uniref:Uncharacterized protein n=1 Tax=Celeribacter indicus TaxID=1208324 RepID=A0A0B5DYW4_9RHOB|nr:hypothetical protein [Celeribacter indicus]AJE45422.1 hypothetical protein P73_0707 [Celeribacter indicus]SDX01588.1 hypothetical protein SAMN05443573_11188 [Celeribacter indicus]
MPSDKFMHQAAGLTAPARNAFPVTASDTADLPHVTRGLYLGGGGSVTLLLAGDDSPVTFGNMAAGVVHPLRVKRVLASGLTASGLVGIF